MTSVVQHRRTSRLRERDCPEPGVYCVINARRGTPGARVWQRNYYEHIIRNAVRANGRAPLHAIRHYIIGTPWHWHLYRYNPDATCPAPRARDLWCMLQADAHTRPRRGDPTGRPNDGNHPDTLEGRR